MKKTYISPESLVIQLAPITTLAASLPQSGSDDNSLEGTEILSREYNFNNVFIFDDEW